MRYVIHIRRSQEGVRYVQKYVIDADPNTSVLNVLIAIREDVDGTVAFRYACRMGVCGICAVKINGRARLACNTKLSDLGTNDIYIEPVADRVIRDLVTE